MAECRHHRRGTKGIEKLRPRDPQRADSIAAWLGTLAVDFAGRIVGVDLAVADRWGRLLASTRPPPIDALLAATALVHGLTLVTRNIRDMAGTGVDLVDPFVPA